MFDHFIDADGDNVLDSAEILAAVAAEDSPQFTGARPAHNVIGALDLALLYQDMGTVGMALAEAEGEVRSQREEMAAEWYQDNFQNLINKEPELAERFSKGVDFKPQDVEEASKHGVKVVIVPPGQETGTRGANPI